MWRYLIACLVALVFAGCNQHSDRLVERHVKFSERLVNELGRLGQTKDGAAIESFVKDCPGVTHDDALTAIIGVVQGGPDVPLPRQMDVARNVGKLAVLLDDKCFAETCELAGFVAAMNPKLSPDDCADTALGTYQHFQKYSGAGPSKETIRAIRRLVQRENKSFDTALAMAMVATKSGEQLEKLLEK